MNNAIGDHETRITNNTSSITSLTTRVAEAEADILEVDSTLTQNYTSFNEQLTSLSGRVTTLEGGSNSGSSCSCPSDFDGAVKAVPFTVQPFAGLDSDVLIDNELQPSKTENKTLGTLASDGYCRSYKNHYRLKTVEKTLEPLTMASHLDDQVEWQPYARMSSAGASAVNFNRTERITRSYRAFLLDALQYAYFGYGDSQANKRNITTLTSDVSSLKTADSTINTTLGDHETRITNNTSSITSLDGRVTTLETPVVRCPSTPIAEEIESILYSFMPKFYDENHLPDDGCYQRLNTLHERIRECELALDVRTYNTTCILSGDLTTLRDDLIYADNNRFNARFFMAIKFIEYRIQQIRDSGKVWQENRNLYNCPFTYFLVTYSQNYRNSYYVDGVENEIVQEMLEYVEQLFDEVIESLSTPLIDRDV